MNRLLLALIAAGAALLPVAASAHPHVFVTMKTEVVYAPDGSVTGVRQAWTFDDMFSIYATQGLEQKTKGVFTREELAPLAEVNVTSLKEFDFFTYVTANGAKAEFDDPKDYWLEFSNDTLTLHYTLLFKAPLKAKAFDLEVYDPSYFVDFSFVEKDPVTLAGAPARCKASVAKPQGLSMGTAKSFSESMFNQPGAANFGAQFANKIAVTCQ